jgi:hypothetical protein
MALIAEAQGRCDLTQRHLAPNEHLLAALDTLSHLVFHGAAPGRGSKQSDHVEATDACERCQLIRGEPLAQVSVYERKRAAKAPFSQVERSNPHQVAAMATRIKSIAVDVLLIAPFNASHDQIHRSSRNEMMAC